MAKKDKNGQIVIVIVLLLLAFFVGRNYGLFTIFGDLQGYNGELPPELYGYFQGNPNCGAENLYYLDGMGIDNPFSNDVFSGNNNIIEMGDCSTLSTFNLDQDYPIPCATNSGYETDYISVEPNTMPGLGTARLIVKYDVVSTEIVYGDFFEMASDNIMIVNVDSLITENTKLFVWVARVDSSGNLFDYYDLTKDVSLVSGMNTIEFILPQELVVGEWHFFIVPVYKNFWVNDFAKIRGTCQTIEENRKAWIQMDALNSQNFLIHPKPVYVVTSVGADCPEGYEPQNGDPNNDEGLCVRDDLFSLACIQLGCPVINNPVEAGYTYECGSNGLCSQELYQIPSGGCQSDGDCESGQVCNVDSGVCWEEVVINQIIQCESSSDCMSPCNGITVTCESNFCVYTGVCDVVQCYSGSDCFIPCEGINVGCSNGQCTYDGTCEVEQCTFDFQCESPCNGVASSCENGLCAYDGTCEVEQCTYDGDCFIPCEGVTTTCDGGLCTYNGTCEPEWMTDDIDTNVEIHPTFTRTPTPTPTTPTDEDGINYTWIVVIIGAGALIWFLTQKKKK